MNIFFIEDYVGSSSAHEVSSYSQLSKSKQLSKEEWVPALGFRLGLDFVALMSSPQVPPFGGCQGAPVVPGGVHLQG